MKRLMILICFWLAPFAAAAQDLIHSDLPLWTSESEKMWPHSFQDGQTFGCLSRVAFGDWKYVGADAENDKADEPDGWFRFANYGVFHCYMLDLRASEREGLAREGSKPAFMIELGKARSPSGEPLELWAIQSGGRPGSDYMLLARVSEPGVIKSFQVLKQECPRGRRRATPPIDIMATDYCAINTQQELNALARRMARLPPLGVLEFVGDVKEENEGP